MRIVRRAGRARRSPAVGIEKVIDAYDRQIDVALHHGLRCHRDGEADDVGLTETVIAVQTAQALERLTGVDWERHLDGRAETVARLDESGGPQPQ